MKKESQVVTADNIFGSCQYSSQKEKTSEKIHKIHQSVIEILLYAPFNFITLL